MAEDVKEVVKQSAEAVKKPVENWRKTVAEADTIVEKTTRHYRAVVFQGYLVGAVVVFVILAVLAKTIAYFTFDVTITQEVQECKVWGFDPLMYSLSWIGFSPQTLVISGAVILFLYVSGLKWETVVIFASLIGITTLGRGIKLIVHRPRPSPDLTHVVKQLSSYSFPSGHVLYFTAFFGFLLFLVYTLLKPSWWRSLLLIILGAMVALIGLSRIYEGHHWASDVIAAYLLGSVWLSLSILVYRWGKPRFFVNQPVAKETPI